jgi:phospholipid N-methyltransferase
MMNTFAPHVSGHVVEYGPGAGTVSSYLVPFSAKLTPIEPSPNLVPVLRRQFQALPQVEVVDASLEEHAIRVSNDAVDTIALVNVLEHVEDDRAAVLNRLLGQYVVQPRPRDPQRPVRRAGQSND